MVLGLSSKNRKGSSVQADYLIHIHEIKPWPPSQSLRSLRNVVIQWENGGRNSGSTNVVCASLGSVIGEGKIELNESFKLPVTMTKDMSAARHNKDAGVAFLKNVLEFNLYEARREKTHQLLATATIDLADFGIIKDTLSVTAAMNSKRSYRNTSQPVLFLTIQPLDGRPSDSSSKKGRNDASKNDNESVSALMNDEYSEEAEIASFTDDDDISSHSSSLAVSSSTLESNGGFSARTEEEEQERMGSSGPKGSNNGSSRRVEETEQGQVVKQISSSPSSIDMSSIFNLPEDASMSAQEDNVSVLIGNGIPGSAKETSMLEGGNQDGTREPNSGSFPLDDDSQNPLARGSESRENLKREVDANEKVEKSRNMKSVRSSLDDATSSGKTNEQKQDKKKATRDAVLENKIKNLESKVKKLESELREAAAIEASLYSVVAEHASSMSKVHAPARRLSRLYLHASTENSSSRRAPTAAAAAAKSAVSGLLLVAKACGNDVPRLTFWLSNAVVLRAIIHEATLEEELPVSAGPHPLRKKDERESEKKQLPLKWKDSPLNKKDNKSAVDERFGEWDDPMAFTSALEKVEAWIFSRVVESIWWQTLTPRMQSDAAAASALGGTNLGCDSKRSFGRRGGSSVNQEQCDLSVRLWIKAFREACERLCPLRASGHECGCLPLPARLIMEQCVARLDVAMFNAILRDSDESIPTDPVSDPIGDPRVLPIPCGQSSFGSGAQLKNAIGNWSRWLTDLFGIDDEEEGSDDRSCKTFKLLNALSDVMMLPKEMLLKRSVREEVCPMFGAALLKRTLTNFVPDEFCSDPVPSPLLEALASEQDEEEEEKEGSRYPCSAAPPLYSPPSPTSISAFVGDIGGRQQQSKRGRMRSSSSSIRRKAYTSDDELDELTSPLALILEDAGGNQAVRYGLVREIWMQGQ